MPAAHFIENDEVAHRWRESAEERENLEIDRCKLELRRRCERRRRLRRLLLLRALAACFVRAASLDAHHLDALRRLAFHDRTRNRQGLRTEEQAEDQR